MDLLCNFFSFLKQFDFNSMVGTTAVKQSTRVSLLHIVLAALLIFVATMMTFVNSVNAGFVNWDDDAYVTENPLVQSLTPESIGRLFSQTYYYAWIPATLLSHAVDVAVWGMNPRGHHLTNVLLHSFNAVLLFLVGLIVLDAARRTGKVAGTPALVERITSSMLLGAAVGAMLFAMHPLRVESVAWVSGRKDLLCAVFLLPSFGAYLVWKLRGERKWLIASIVLFALALLAKPMAAPFPVILLLVDVWLVGKAGDKLKPIAGLLKEKLVFFLLSGSAAFMTMFASFGGRIPVVGELTFVERSLLPVYAIVFYLWKTIAPFDLSPIYPEMNTVLLYLSPIVFVGVAHVSVVVLGKRNNATALTFFSYALFLLPTFLGLSTGTQPIADRYTYLATISIFLFIGGMVELLWRKTAASPAKLYRRELLLAALLLLCAVNAYRTIRHLAVWDSSVSLWTQALRSAPATHEEFESRKPYLKPNYLDAHINLGTAHYVAGDNNKAIEQFNTVLALDSGCADAHYNLGNLKFETGDAEGSMVSFKKAVESDPGYAKAYYNMGILYVRQDSIGAAVEAFRKAAQLGFPDAQKVLRERGFSW